MRLKIRQKLLMVFLGIAIVSTTTIFILNYTVSSRALTNKVKEELMESVSRSSKEVDNFLRDQEGEVLSLAQLPILKALLYSLRSENYDDFDRKREILERFFLRYQEHKGAIQAIRVVDTKGQVLVKIKELKIIEKNKPHPYIPITTVGSLYEKEFFDKLMTLKKGQVWMSNFELGVDNNQFCPPMIRLSTPIFYRDGKRAGFIVINIWGKRIGEIINNTITKDNGYSFIFEKNLHEPHRHGIYLSHPDAGLCFLNQTNKGRLFFEDYPDGAELITRDGGVIQAPSSGNLMAYVYYSPYKSQQRGWYIVTMAYGDRVLGPVLKQRQVMVTVSLVTFIMVGIAAVLLSRAMTRPISLLARGVKEVGEGNLDHRIAVSSGDEIGELAKSFNSMSTALKENIEKRMEADARACQAEKLASIGELAAGVAHEINNPLGNIISISRLLEQDINNGNNNAEAIKADIDTIIKEGMKCERIISGLLNFSREVPLHKSMEDINCLIDEVIHGLKYKIENKKLTVYRDYEKMLPMIYVDKAQMQQVFSNIILNSIHATETGGSIKVITRPYDNRVEVEISDTGVGISKENIKRVFDPFFTTKDVGEGTGLGLAVSYGIVQKHMGSINIESELGEGTRCIITLPCDGGSHV
ncbi:MAG: sensor histidine kinase [Nitrospirae bacterium]|nr:sensor histidine kinase [Nitrospirota bacterium]